MAITVTSIGTAVATSATAVNITATSGVPAGVVINVAIMDRGTGGTVSGTMTDSGGNSYIAWTSAKAPNAVSSDGSVGFMTVLTSLVIASSGHLTYTPLTSNGGVASAFYLTGTNNTIDGVNSGNFTFGSSASPSFPFSVPSVANSLLMACLGTFGPVADTFTQDSTNGAYQNFPVRAGITSGLATIAGGCLVSSTGPSYAPTITSRPWAITAFAINPAATGTNANVTGVAGTGSAGTGIASIGKSPTGVAGTGGAGTVTASVGKAPTGVTGTGSAGTLVPSLRGNLTGAAGTGSAGTATAQNSKTLTGAAGTGGVGTFTGQDSGSMGGVGGTGQAGLDGASLAVLPGGVAGTGQVGVLQGVQGQNAVISGVGGTGQAGTLTDQVSAAATGVAGTGQAGTETAQTGASIAGIGGTGQAGSLSGGASGGIGGVGGTGQASSPGIEVDASISGVGATGQAGTLTTSIVNPPAVVTAVQGGPGDSDEEAEGARQKWLEWSRKKRLKEKAKLAVPQPIVADAQPVAAIPPGQSLLERNLHAQRLQIMQQAMQQAIADEVARQQEEDDEEAIALLLDA